MVLISKEKKKMKKKFFEKIFSPPRGQNWPKIGLKWPKFQKPEFSQGNE